jgi:hypothetical protein
MSYPGGQPPYEQHDPYDTAPQYGSNSVLQKSGYNPLMAGFGVEFLY